MRQRNADAPDETEDESRGHFLTSAVDDSGEEFLTDLLRTAEFTGATLKPLGGRGAKDVAARLVAYRYSAGQLSASQIFLAMVQRPRLWLAFKCGHVGNIVEQQPIETFFESFGAHGWFGPVEGAPEGQDDDGEPAHEGGESLWFVYVKHIKYMLDSETPTRLRWHLIAEVRNDLIALHWANFDIRAPGAPNDFVEFAYWHHVPDIMSDLAEITNFKGDWPDLNVMVLHKALKEYETKPDYTWDHQRIRAEQDSVAISASGFRKRGRGRSSSSSGGVLDLSGIRALTKKIAEAAIAELKAEKSLTMAVENRILKTFLYEWGTKSYEFALEGNGEEYRMHVYFGSHRGSKGADSFPHVRNWIEKGGGRISLNFLLRYIV